jgi:hypothetical protein
VPPLKITSGRALRFWEDLYFDEDATASRPSAANLAGLAPCI